MTYFRHYEKHETVQNSWVAISDHPIYHKNVGLVTPIVKAMRLLQNSTIFFKQLSIIIFIIHVYFNNTSHKLYKFKVSSFKNVFAVQSCRFLKSLLNLILWFSIVPFNQPAVAPSFLKTV